MHIAITGHRPKDLQNLGVGYRQVAELTREVHARAVARAALGEYITLHTGGALGVDTWTAQSWQDLQLTEQGLFHVLHTPFQLEVMGKMWSRFQNDVAESVAKNADERCDDCMAEEFDYAQYQRRNECMVNASTYVIAFYNGKQGGGTYNCVRYALAHGYRVYNALDEFKPIKELR